MGYVLLGRSFLAGLGASLLGWYIVSYVPYLRFFLGLVVGAAVGEVMSRLALRRKTITLEIAAVAAVIGGLVLISLAERAAGIDAAYTLGSGASLLSAYLLFPAIVASIVAVVKLH
jgi:hypothetical protein